MKSFITIITSVVCSVAAVAVPQEQASQNPQPLDASSRDSSVKPGDDFFLFANGSWIKQTEIPPEYSRWGAFNELIERNNDALHTIAEKASQTHRLTRSLRRRHRKSVITTRAGWTRRRSKPRAQHP